MLWCRLSYPLTLTLSRRERGYRERSRALPEVADVLGAGVAKALLGKAVIPDGLPYCTGPIGLLGSKPSYEMMQQCDTLLMVGTSFPYAEFLPEAGQARGVQIEIKPRLLSLRYLMEVPLHGEAKLTLQALLPMLKRKTDRSWRQQIEQWTAEWWQVLETRAYIEADPINPQRLVWELSPRLPERCIVTADSGSVVNWFARDLKLRRGMMSSLSGGLATMCPGVPYALAAKFAYPERAVVALVGDGAMQMLGNNSLITVARHWREWDDPRLIVCVLNNQDLMPLTPFLLYTALGTGLWTALLAFAGRLLGEGYAQVETYLGPVTYGVLGLTPMALPTALAPSPPPSPGGRGGIVARFAL
jgi:pyruvate dehydrogenase (quinone)